jgi:hypothetical protein
MQENGIGALRSQSYGRFDIMQWEKIDILSSAPGTERANRRPAEAVFAH